MDSMDNAKHLRDTVFNTINLINDLESDDSQNSSSHNVRRSSKEDVMLSDRFVNGIKDKQIDPSKLQSQDFKDNSTLIIEKHKEEVKSYMEANFLKLRDVIKSQHSEILSLKQEIVSLKSKISSEFVRESVAETSTSTQNSNSSFIANEQIQSNNFNGQSNDISQQSMIHHEDNGRQQSIQSNFISENSNGQQSLNSNFNNSSFANEGFTESPRQEFHTSQVPQQASQQVPQQIPNEMHQQSEQVSQQTSQPAREQVPQEAVNPRVGNYQSSDVLIEKYFYYGNKK